MSSADHQTKLFNTAIIATKVPKNTNYSTRLNALVKNRAFKTILKTIAAYAEETGMPQDQAAEEIVQTFREIDAIWDEYIFHEGLEKLKSHLNS